jgi:hypothetical protein
MNDDDGCLIALFLVFFIVAVVGLSIIIAAIKTGCGS